MVCVRAGKPASEPRGTGEAATSGPIISVRPRPLALWNATFRFRSGGVGVALTVVSADTLCPASATGAGGTTRRGAGSKQPIVSAKRIGHACFSAPHDRASSSASPKSDRSDSTECHAMPGEPTTIPRDTSSASSRRVIAVALLIAWLPAACLAVSTKYRLLNPLGFEAACDQLKLTIDPHRDPATYFSYFDRLCLMRVDVTIAWAVAPALLVFISRRLRPGLAVAFVITCSTAVTLLLFVQNRCLSTVGSFVTLGMLHDALDWAITEPSVAGPYLLATPNLKLLAAVALIVSTAFAAARWAPRVAPAWMRKRRSWLSLLPGFVVAPIAWIPIVPSSAAKPAAPSFRRRPCYSRRRRTTQGRSPECRKRPSRSNFAK